MMFFNQTQDLRAPSADRRETLYSDQHMRQLFNACPKLGGPPLKIFTLVKFSVDFTQLPIFIANISGTRQDIKNRKDVISNDSSHVQPNKSGELWSTIHRVVHVSLGLPKSTFFDRLYFGP